MRGLSLVVCVAWASAGSVELVAPNLADGLSAGVLDGLKAKFVQKLSIAGTPATLTGLYDHVANKEFFKELSLEGKIESIKYKLKYATGDATTDVTLQTTVKDIALKADGKVGKELSGATLTKVEASRVAKLGGASVLLRPSYALKAGVTKLFLSAPLGDSGLTASGEVVKKKGTTSVDLDYKLQYDLELSKGRTVTASFNPADKTGGVVYVDKTTISDVTTVATFPLGEKPKISLMRSFAF